MSINDVLTWLQLAGPDMAQFALLTFIIVRQQMLIEKCRKYSNGDGDHDHD